MLKAENEASKDAKVIQLCQTCMKMLTKVILKVLKFLLTPPEKGRLNLGDSQLP